MGLLNADPQAPASRGAPIIAISIAAAVVLCVATWFYVAHKRAEEPMRTFDSPSLGCRFEFASDLAAGPNFVRTQNGAFLTIERHSLVGADPSFVAGLPDALFEQVLIQLKEGYPGLEELSRRNGTLGGRPALHVEERGHAGGSAQWTRIAIDIAATDAWVWVLRAYYPEASRSEDEAALEHVRSTMTFLPEGAPQATR